MENIASTKKKKKKAKTPANLELLGDVTMKPVFQRVKNTENTTEHEFWKEQPVPNFTTVGSITDNPNCGYLKESLEGVRTVPFDLPPGYEWVAFDIGVSADLDVVYKFLRQYYSNTFGTFQLDYSRDMLKWCMCPPGYFPSLHIGIKCKDDLVGFIAGVPCSVRIYGISRKMVEINFLCIHPEKRSMKLAPLLIEEVARRVKFTGIWQAVYTATLVLPHGLATAQYYHRPINVKKLIDTGFMHKNPKLTLAGTIKYYQLSASQHTVRQLTSKDIPGACALLNKFLAAYHISQEFTNEEFEHTFSPREGIMYCYVNIVDGKICDFISFYGLSSTINGNAKYNELRGAYSYYNIAGSMSWEELMNIALNLAAEEKFDVFNALDIMENMQFVKSLKFNQGTGKLRYHLYNWNCLPTKPEGIGMTLR